jgi:hypothetical protein
MYVCVRARARVCVCVRERESEFQFLNLPVDFHATYYERYDEARGVLSNLA